MTTVYLTFHDTMEQICPTWVQSFNETHPPIPPRNSMHTGSSLQQFRLERTPIYNEQITLHQNR